MRFQFGRILNPLIAYDRINKIYKITVRTKSCHRWRRFCRKKDIRKIPLKSPNMPPNEALLKGPLIFPQRHVRRWDGYVVKM